MGFVVLRAEAAGLGGGGVVIHDVEGTPSPRIVPRSPDKAVLPKLRTSVGAPGSTDLGVIFPSFQNRLDLIP